MRQITENWWIDVDKSFGHRIEDGSIVFWKPGRTIWINCWGDGVSPTKAEALAGILEDADPHRRQIADEDDNEVYRFIYSLVEEDGSAIRYAVYLFAIVDGEYLQIGVYVDALDDLAWAVYFAKSPIFQKA